MAASMQHWKRGLLKAWLALSLLWGAAVTLLLVIGTVEVFEAATWQTSATATAFILLAFLPLATLPPLALLGFGVFIIWITDRLRPAHEAPL